MRVVKEVVQFDHHGVSQCRTRFMGGDGLASTTPSRRPDVLSPDLRQCFKEVKRAMDPRSLFGVPNGVLGES